MSMHELLTSPDWMSASASYSSILELFYSRVCLFSHQLDILCITLYLNSFIIMLRPFPGHGQLFRLFTFLHLYMYLRPSKFLTQSYNTCVIHIFIYFDISSHINTKQTDGSPARGNPSLYLQVPNHSCMETFGALSRFFSPLTCTPNFLGLLVQKITLCCRPEAYGPNELKLDLAFNNVKPKDKSFVLD